MGFRGRLPFLGELPGEVLMSETATGKGTSVLRPTLMSPRLAMLILEERNRKDHLPSKCLNGEAFPGLIMEITRPEQVEMAYRICPLNSGIPALLSLRTICPRQQKEPSYTLLNRVGDKERHSWGLGWRRAVSEADRQRPTDVLTPECCSTRDQRDLPR